MIFNPPFQKKRLASTLQHIRIASVFLCASLLLHACATKKKIEEKPQTPIMGWSSWNNFHVNINEDIIKAQADHMVSSGMKDAGYRYINIDDGFFGGRDANGQLLCNKEKFPHGMKAVADYIHSQGLKAGIYSDAGINTCGSYWDKDSLGFGVGLYGHDKEDLQRMLVEWGFDFIKVDWCGGDWLGLDEETRYTEIGRIVRQLKPEAVFNICRWEFPGTWALQVANSWRISGDIANRFQAVCHIIDINADLWKYSSAGHFNDMDMLQVGRGMSYEEDKTHFTMWCMMNSPLLAGNDLREMTDETIGILTNKEIIALNQDRLCYQARKIKDDGDLEVWAKPLISTISGKVAVVLLNRSEEKQTVTFQTESIGIESKKGYTMRDLWLKKAYSPTTADKQSFEVEAHGVVALLINGESLPFNIFQKK